MVISVPSLPQVTSVVPGAGTNMACVGMALSPMSGRHLQCRLSSQQDSSLWAVGLATPWPYVSCQHTLCHARISRSPTHSKLPQRTLPWTKRNWKDRRSGTSTQSSSDRMSHECPWESTRNKVTDPDNDPWRIFLSVSPDGWAEPQTRAVSRCWPTAQRGPSYGDNIFSPQRCKWGRDPH